MGGGGGPYSGAGTWFSTSYCLAEGKYQFAITDSYGDGICCGYGEGKYEIWGDGALLHTGGDFGQSGSEIFGSCGGPGNCDNDPTWRFTTYNGKIKECGWVANKPDKRCSKVGNDGRVASEACPGGCNAACVSKSSIFNP